MVDNNALPPGPFQYETTALIGKHPGKGHVYLIDANGRKIATIWGPAETKIALVNLIIEAKGSNIDIIEEKNILEPL